MQVNRGQLQLVVRLLFRRLQSVGGQRELNN
jgi:hypothetical protein